MLRRRVAVKGREDQPEGADFCACELFRLAMASAWGPGRFAVPAKPRVEGGNWASLWSLNNSHLVTESFLRALYTRRQNKGNRRGGEGRKGGSWFLPCCAIPNSPCRRKFSSPPPLLSVPFEHSLPEARRGGCRQHWVDILDPNLGCTATPYLSSMFFRTFPRPSLAWATALQYPRRLRNFGRPTQWADRQPPD